MGGFNGRTRGTTLTGRKVPLRVWGIIRDGETFLRPVNGSVNGIHLEGTGPWTIMDHSQAGPMSPFASSWCGRRVVEDRVEVGFGRRDGRVTPSTEVAGEKCPTSKF